MSKFSKIIAVLAFFAALMFFACAENEPDDLFGNEVSSSSDNSGDPGNPSSPSGNLSSGGGIGLSSSGQGGGTLPDNIAKKGNTCYVCNPERSGIECSVSEWELWIKRTCSERDDPHWCSEVQCPGTITPSSSSRPGTSLSSAVTPRSSSSAGRAQTKTCPIGNLVTFGSAPPNPYSACFKHTNNKCYTCKVENEANGSTCASSWVWESPATVDDNISKNLWYYEVPCPASGGTSSSSQVSARSSSSQSSGNSGYTPKTAGTATSKTTQYWDACKPSCAWSGNGGKRASSCSITGNKIGSTDSPSACDGGGEFACMNQAPWKVGNVSFGYVAAGIGQCGDCWQFDFPNGEVMVVMKSNIGDIKEGALFDLMIPGGGVGDFDALSRQVQGSGVSNANMGERYGGFRGAEGWTYSAQKVQNVRNRCNDVFKNLPDLKAGCLWYANTLGTDDASWNNPTVRYQQVTCPKELTDRY